MIDEIIWSMLESPYTSNYDETESCVSKAIVSKFTTKQLMKETRLW